MTTSDLQKIALFDGVDIDILESYARRCAWQTHEASEMIIDHMETSTDVRFILSGSVRIVVRMSEGREVILNDFGEGQHFGELAAIDHGVRSANVTAQTRVRICVMPSIVFREICADVPEVGLRVMQHLVHLVRMLSDRLSEFSFLKARHRLYAELLRLSRLRTGPNLPPPTAEDEAGTTDRERIISPIPRQSDIADRISSRREIVSREMKELERQGITAKSRGGLVILNPRKLSTMAAEGWLG